MFVATNDCNALYTDDSVALQDPFLNVRVIDSDANSGPLAARDQRHRSAAWRNR